MFLGSVRALLAAALAAGCGNGGVGSADGPRPPHTAVADDHGVRGPLLWEVPGASGPSYLMGTIHGGFRPESELPAWVWDKLDACDTFVMELDPTAVSPAEVMRLARLPDGQSLEQMLGPEDWKRLRAQVAAPESSLKQLQPWAALMLLLQSLEPTPVPLDEALRRRAVEKGKQLAYLEDWKQQAEIAAMVDVHELRELLVPDGKARRQLAALLAAYRAGDFERLSAIALDPEEIAENPKRHARLFDERNRAWVGVLAPYLDRGRTFVAVGAGHFAGPQGLIELLRARGYVLARTIAP